MLIASASKTVPILDVTKTTAGGLKEGSNFNQREFNSKLLEGCFPYLKSSVSVRNEKRVFFLALSSTHNTVCLTESHGAPGYWEGGRKGGEGREKEEREGWRRMENVVCMYTQVMLGHSQFQ